MSHDIRNRRAEPNVPKYRFNHGGAARARYPSQMQYIVTNIHTVIKHMSHETFTNA